MAFGTGEKVRKIKAFDVQSSSKFVFNRSIHPNGGILGRMDLSSTKRGHRQVKLYQDLNNDGKVSRRELIYKGKCLQPFEEDELVSFNGDIRMQKSMHMCDWMMLKKPDKLFACTMEYIPTAYELALLSSAGELYEFEATGEFVDPSYLLI